MDDDTKPPAPPIAPPAPKAAPVAVPKGKTAEAFITTDGKGTGVGSVDAVAFDIEDARADCDVRDLSWQWESPQTSSVRISGATPDATVKVTFNLK